MDYRKISYFLKVVDTMNISRAAEQINISHQGLSKQIHLLENELGTPLLERGSSGLILTETGKKLNEWFRPILSEADYRYQKLQEYILEKKTILNIGYFNALSYRQCIVPLMDSISALQQDMKIEVLATDLGHVKKLLLNDKIDLAVTTMITEKDWAAVNFNVLQTCPFRIIVSANHPWYQKEKITEEDLQKETLLFYDTGSPGFFSHMKVKERISCYNFDSYMSKLEDGHSFGLVADIYNKREGDFLLLDLPDCYAQTCSIIAAYRKEHPLRSLFEQI